MGEVKESWNINKWEFDNKNDNFSFNWSISRSFIKYKLVNKTYEKVSIELYDNEKLNELSQLLKTEGKTKINIILNNDNKKYAFELEKSRKFDFATFSAIKDKQYVKKISF